MGESESLDKNVKTAEAALSMEKKQVEGEKKQAQDRTAADKAEIAELMRERATIAAAITPRVLSEYERIRKGRAGVAIAEAIDGRCSKCHITLRPQFLQELKRGDAIMVCESCKRMLYVNNPQSFDDLVPQSVRV
jgi:predicted  nucleic acid-binding Zn-ribbon protein